MLENKRVFGRDISNTMHQMNPHLQAQMVNLKLSNKENYQKSVYNNQQHNDQLRPEFFKAQPQSFFKSHMSTYRTNPQNVDEYIQDILKHTFEQQKMFRVNPDYMDWQKDIDKNMRKILVDWLIDVAVKFKLLNETVFIAVNLIDRYLQDQQIQRQYLQLVGVCCLFMASKYNEIYPPELKDFVYVTDNAYNKEQVLEMESMILKSINFQLNYSSPNYFYQKLKQLWKQDQNKLDYLAMYLQEISLLNLELSVYSPLQIAASSIYLVNKLFKHHEVWSHELQQITGFQENDVRPCAKQMCILISQIESDTQNLSALKRKYSSQKYLGVSSIRVQKTNQSHN